MKKSGDWEAVERYQRELKLLGGVSALLDWDQQVLMPRHGVNARAEQSAFLSELMHRKIVSNELFDVLKKLRRKNLKGDNGLIVEKLYEDVVRSRKIPEELVSELARATALGHQAWQNAREKNDFRVFEPHLKKIVELKRKQAQLIGLKGHLYNSLLDDFEEGMTVEKLRPEFEKLKVGLKKLLRKIESSEKYKKQKISLLNKKFPADYQNEIVRDIAERMGLSFEKTRIDLSEHPFTTKIGTGDVRFTIAVRESPLFAIESGIHEAGHALYESNLPEKHEYNILGDAPSLGIHESQSRFWENMIGKGESFWKFYFPRINKKLGLGKFREWCEEVNFVTPGFVRVEADEVHYCLHIILRFEIELGLIDGSVKVSELPKVWNEKFRELFGRTPRNDVEGVLQDVHWSGGMIGYFPTYALGSVYAAQLYEALKKKHKRIEKEIARGRFGKVSEWLKENVHRHGSRYLADEIVRKATGRGLDVGIYLNYLNKKYGKIYGFE